MLQLALHGSLGASELVAILGDRIPAAALSPLLRSPWILCSSNATPSELAAATAFIEAPTSLLSNATHGKLYQYAFTGIPSEFIAQIPPRFTVANTHQSSIPIAEYVLAAVLDSTGGASWHTSPHSAQHTVHSAQRTARSAHSSPGSANVRYCHPSSFTSPLISWTTSLTSYKG